MSVFEDPTKGQETEETNTTESWMDQVVAEKGDHWKDPETLAKGYLHAQQRIAELSKYEEESKKNDYAKQLLEQLQGKQTPTPTEPEAKEGNQAEETTTPKPDELQGLIEKTIAERELKSRQEQNLKQVDTKLTELFGTEASSAVQKRAQELGMSLTHLKDIAGESPNAFMALIGEAPKPETNSGPQGTLNTAAGFQNGSGKRNWSYYQKLRKENPQEYHSIKTQKAMLEDRKSLGDKFYN